MSQAFKEKIGQVLEETRATLAAATNAADVEEARVRAIGQRGGAFKDLSRELGAMSPADKPEAGKLLNDARRQIEEMLTEAKTRLEGGPAKPQGPALDISLPGRRWKLGRKHPIRQVIDDAVAIFRRVGFIVAEGPEIDNVYHNFDALNTDPYHPSRDEMDTFYFPDGRLLRTQTSTVQIRVMESRRPPIRIVAPGRCFRRDTPDATHSANFHQIEGLYVDRNVSLADLKSVLLYFAREIMGKDMKIRLRPHFFPFTEPSVEYDFSCVMCGGKGCSVCKHSGWLEISGAGMVDPAVLRNVNYDPTVWSGYAFGMGIERIAMIRHGINDIRLLYENNVKFLEQF